MRVVVLDGVKRKTADTALSLAGLLDYFPPGIVGPLLREAKAKGVHLRAANLPDPDTIARGIWAGLTTARSMGAHLGKYGCFPLTEREIDHVVDHVQRWMDGWSAAPVFFVDQGLLADDKIYVERDLPKGMERWLEAVHTRGAKVVLFDTIDKASGRKLLKHGAKDPVGYLGPQQIARVEAYSRKLGIKALWAGGLGLRDAYAMGQLGVFGIYVTSAAATTIPVRGIYARDPALSGVKEPSREAVLRTKILLEAGFLVTQLAGRKAASEIESTAEALLTSLDAGDADSIRSYTATLGTACTKGWRAHWQRSPPR
jgi:hypothetical protein